MTIFTAVSSEFSCIEKSRVWFKEGGWYWNHSSKIQGQILPLVSAHRAFIYTKDGMWLQFTSTIFCWCNDWFTHTYAQISQYSAVSLKRAQFSHKKSQKTSHSSPIRARHGVSFVDSVPDWYFASVSVIINVISYNIFRPCYSGT